MKTFFASILLLLSFAFAALAQTEFSGLEKAMDTDTYERAGLNKLSKEERQILDQFIRDYVAGKEKTVAKEAAQVAVDNAIKEHKVEQPQVIESRIVGTFKGVGLRTVFRLENGQVWAPTGDIAPWPPIQNPHVIIFHDFFGWKMFVEGASTVRVKPVLK